MPKRKPKPKVEVVESEVLNDLLRVGGMMSNVCFNIGQHGASKTITAAQAKSMKQLQVDWDAAVRRLTRQAKGRR